MRQLLSANLSPRTFKITQSGPDPIKILERKFYATLFLQAFWLATQLFQPIIMFKIFAQCKFYSVKNPLLRVFIKNCFRFPLLIIVNSINLWLTVTEWEFRRNFVQCSERRKERLKAKNVKKSNQTQTKSPGQLRLNFYYFFFHKSYFGQTMS